MNSLIRSAFVLLPIMSLAGCEAFANGTWMQDGGARAGRLALVSLHVEGLERASDAARLGATLEAVRFHAEEVLNSQFEVVPASGYVAEAAYRKNARRTTFAAGFAAPVGDHVLATFADDADDVRSSEVPGDTVAQLSVDLGVRWIAAVHVRWGSRMFGTQEIMKVGRDGQVRASDDVKTERRGSFATTTLTIYSRSGIVLCRQVHEALGGTLPLAWSVDSLLASQEQRGTVVDAVTKGLEQAMRQLHQKPGGIEYRPE